MKELFFKIGIVFLGAMLLSVGFNQLYLQAIGKPYVFPKNILPHPEIADKYQIVNLGNSHSEDGVTFEKYKTKSLSLASVAQTYEYDLALLKMHEKQIAKNAVILINVSPISFSQKKPDWNEHINTQYNDGRLSPFLIPHLNISEYLQIQIMPFLRAGYLWRTMHAKDVENRAMNNFAQNWNKTPEVTPTLPTPTEKLMPKEFIRSDIPTFNVPEIKQELDAPPVPSSEKMIESTRFMVAKWNTDAFREEAFESNRKDLQEILDYSIEHGWKPVLVTFPLNQVLVEGLGEGYLERNMYDNLKQVDTKGSPYINFATNPQFTHNKFLYSNSDHLNSKGAAIASYVILRKLIDLKYLPNEVDGYDYR